MLNPVYNLRTYTRVKIHESNYLRTSWNAQSAHRATFEFVVNYTHAYQEPAIPAFSIPIPILRLVLRLVDSDTDTDTRKSENFDSDSDTDTKVKQVL